MRAIDFWWDLELEPARPENYNRCLTEISAARPPRTVPSLIVLGAFNRFSASVIHKSAARTGLFTPIGIHSALPEQLASPDSVFIKWSPYSAYNIADSERFMVPEKKKIINDTHFNCRKENVQRVFETVFGYPLAIDPSTYVGKVVAKSSRNARHDAAIITAPVEHRPPGTVFERVIDNYVGDNLVYDIRLVYLMGKFALAYIKFRPRERRFENFTSFAKLVLPEEVLSDKEIELCENFCKESGLEYGELDVLRDGESGNIYIVDANNTPAGPPKGLSLDERISALKFIGQTIYRDVFLKKI